MNDTKSTLRRGWLVALAVFALCAAGASVADAQTKLLRFPDVHGDTVVFTYGGDLWTASTSGGTATRLTSHPGMELFGKFSADGKWIAFTGQYDGDEQVYVLPATGGMPRQLTYYPARGPLPPRWGYDNQVYDWTKDGHVLFRSMRDAFDLTGSRLYTVSVDGGLPQALPLPYSGAADFSPDESQLVYSPLVRDFRTWKRYEGGWAQELYIFDMATADVVRVTDHPRADRDPMWIGSAVYFTSDRDNVNNLYKYDVATKSISQVTRSQQWDVRWPSDDGSRQIVYELDGALQLLDVASGQTRGLSIEVPHDGLWMRPGRVDASSNVEDYALSPKGERALFVARGDVFSAPIEHGRTYNLTRSSNAHDRDAVWSPDGTEIAYISDRDGEDELWVIKADGTGEPRQLTDGNAAYLEGPLWSPTGEHIAYSDQTGRIYVYDVQRRRSEEIADDSHTFGRDYTWSPDGRHLAFSLGESNDFRSLHIWSREDSQVRRVTGPLFSEDSPAWDPAGNYLYYLSTREFAPQIGSYEWNYVLDREVLVYALALRKDVKHPVPPRMDEVSTEADEDAQEDGEDEKKDKKKSRKKKRSDKNDEPEEKIKPIKIDFDGLGQRVSLLPIPADNYFGLVANDGHVLYTKTGPFYYGRQSDIQPTLKIFSFKEREESDLVEAVRGYVLSDDGKKLLVRTRQGFARMDAKPKADKSKKSVSTSGLQADRVPAQEWRQIFHEVWRRYRDFFYVDNMHGYDWPALRAQYEPWLDHLAHRSDLNYVIGEMIAELNVGHAYISGGDYEIPDRPSSALPGARFELDASAGRYKIAKIFAGHNAESEYRSPLTEVGVNISEGDYVLAIDGEPLTASDNPYRMLRHRADGPVKLTVHSSPQMQGARSVVYQPITSESNLMYLEWIEDNRARVERETGGRAGYLHLPNMGARGIQEFIKWYYPQIDKEGLVIDVRGNGGGNVSGMIIQRLQRELLMIDYERNRDYWEPYPSGTFYGHMVCLLDEDTASDGDQFSYVFKRAGLGPLIGKRSWGGVVGIYGRAPLIDGGSVNVPESGTADSEGKWIIEGYGVDPDIEVENDPKSLLAGRDPQLERGIRELMDRIRKDPRPRIAPPKPPIKTP